MTDASLSDPAALARELAEVKEREARYRLKVAQDFLVLQTQLKAHRARIDEINDELGRRNTYIHDLHHERLEWEKSLQRLHEDVAEFMQRLAVAEAEGVAQRSQVSRMRRSWGWGMLAPLRQLQKRLRPETSPSVAPARPSVPSAAFVYFLKTSPFRLFRAPRFTLRGWAFPADGRAVTALRVRIDDREFIGRHGLEEPDVIAQHAPQNNPRPGFEVTFDTPPGRHELSLEAQLEHRDWVSILRTPIWSEATGLPS